MKIHEYQAKEILASHGVPVPRGVAVTTPREAKRAASELGGKVVVKAQIHAGGRGKGRLVASQAKTAAMYQKLEANPKATEGAVRGSRVGGVRLVDSADRAQAEAKKILGKYLVTHQTGPEGKKVQRLLIEEQFAIADEYYAAVLVDSTLGTPVLIVSMEGGQAIEEVAARNPKAIIRVPIDPVAGFPAYRGRQLAKRLKMPQPVILPGGQPLRRAVPRLPGVRRLHGRDQPLRDHHEQPRPGRRCEGHHRRQRRLPAAHRGAARQVGRGTPWRSWPKRPGSAPTSSWMGTIGCMVNGAGLAMATMDTIMLAGGRPANFLDIGTVNQVDLVVQAVHHHQP